MQLLWRPTPVASGFHAAVAMLEERSLLDANLGAALQPAVDALAAAFQPASVDRAVFCEHLVPVSAGVMGSAQLASVVLTKTLGSDQAKAHLSQYAGLLRDISRAYSAARPQLADELPQRVAPLEQQWRARGPGLLKEIGRLTDDVLLVARAEVMLVEPVLGGSGRAHILYNSVRIEALLTNENDQLPEVVRLAWLLSQLNLELPMHSERIHRDRLRLLAPLAMLPVVLAAAEHVELARCDAATIKSAIHSWRCTVPSNMPNSIPVEETLYKWWQTYTSSRPSWAVALAALDSMMES